MDEENLDSGLEREGSRQPETSFRDVLVVTKAWLKTVGRKKTVITGCCVALVLLTAVSFSLYTTKHNSQLKVEKEQKAVAVKFYKHLRSHDQLAFYELLTDRARATKEIDSDFVIDASAISMDNFLIKKINKSAVIVTFKAIDEDKKHWDVSITLAKEQWQWLVADFKDTQINS